MIDYIVPSEEFAQDTKSTIKDSESIDTQNPWDGNVKSKNPSKNMSNEELDNKLNQIRDGGATSHKRVEG